MHGKTAEQLFPFTPRQLTATVSPLGLAVEQALTLGRIIRLQLPWADLLRKTLPLRITDRQKSEEQAAQIQKVSTQLEASKPTPQVVNNP